MTKIDDFQLFRVCQSIKAENHLKNFIEDVVKPRENQGHTRCKSKNPVIKHTEILSYGLDKIRFNL